MPTNLQAWRAGVVLVQPAPRVHRVGQLNLLLLSAVSLPCLCRQACCGTTRGRACLSVSTGAAILARLQSLQLRLTCAAKL